MTNNKPDAPYHPQQKLVQDSDDSINDGLSERGTDLARLDESVIGDSENKSLLPDISNTNPIASKNSALEMAGILRNDRTTQLTGKTNEGSSFADK